MKSKEITVNKPFFKAELFDYGAVLKLVIFSKDLVSASSDCRTCPAFQTQYASAKPTHCTGVGMNDEWILPNASILLDARMGTADEKLNCGAVVEKQTYKRKSTKNS